MTLSRAERRSLLRLAGELGSLGPRLAPEPRWARPDFVIGLASVCAFGAGTLVGALEDGERATSPPGGDVRYAGWA